MKSTKYEMGKQIEEKKYKFSGLKKLEQEHLNKLIASVEFLSILYKEYYFKDEKLSKKLIEELDFLRSFFVMTVSRCQLIAKVKRSQEVNNSQGGRKKELEVKLILMLLIFKYKASSKKYPSAKRLHDLLISTASQSNKRIEEINENNKSSKNGKKSNHINKKFIEASQSTCNKALKEFKSLEKVDFFHEPWQPSEEKFLENKIKKILHKLVYELD